MAGNKCCYLNCGKSGYANQGLRLFRLPGKHAERCREWLINSGNIELVHLSPSKLSRKRICQDHFTQDSFLPSGKYLKPDAVPISYKAEQEEFSVKTPERTYASLAPQPSTSSRQGVRRKLEFGEEPLPKRHSQTEIPREIHILTPPKTSTFTPSFLTPTKSSQTETSWLREICEFPSPSAGGITKTTKSKIMSPTEDTPRKRKLKSTVLKKNLRLKSTRSQISNLKRKVKFLQSKISLDSVLAGMRYRSSQQKTLVKMQLLHKNRKPWQKDEKQFSLNLYYRAPHAYRHLLEQKIVLPSVSTIKYWIGSSKFLPGFNNKLLNEIKRKADNMSEDEKYCIICFDEMAIKKFIEYSKFLDVIEGFEDLGPLGRTETLAKEALVFMARGLYSCWKMPIAYFFSGTATRATNLSRLILLALEELRKCGLKVKGVVCDQGTNNCSALRSLGVTKDQPYFLSEENKCYTFFDAPHLVKSIRNNLLNGEYILNNKTIRFEDIRKTFDIDRHSGTGRSLLKITPAHLNPNNFQKLSVKLATQVFSRTVWAAMKTAIATGELTNPTANDTADFVLLVNNLFDCLNSRSLFSSNPYNCAISEEAILVKKTLEDALNTFSNLQKIDRNGKISRPPCFDGMLQTITAVQSLYRDEKEAGKSFLMTSRVNQDVLENFFSVIRQRGGYSKNPTARMFRTTFRQATINRLLIPPGSANCEPDDDIFLNVDSPLVTPAAAGTSEKPETPTFEAELSDSTTDSYSVSTSPSEDREKLPMIPSLEQCSISYFAGYCAQKLQKKVNCTVCENALLKSSSCDLKDHSELLILYRMYEKRRPDSIGLRAPSKLCEQICTIALEVFKNHFNLVCHEKSVRIRLMNKIMKRIKDTKGIEPLLSEECEHVTSLLEILLVARIHSECKFILQKMQVKEKSKSHSKMDIFKHQ